MKRKLALLTALLLVAVPFIAQSEGWKVINDPSQNIAITEDLLVEKTLTVGSTTSLTGDLTPAADGTYDLGSTTLEWQDLWVDGTAHVDAFGQTLISDTDDTDDLGSASVEWKDLYLDGTATVDAIVNSGALTQTGDITLSGDLDIDTTGKTIKLHDGTTASACMGTGTLNGTTAVTISTTCAATGARIFLTRTSSPTAQGNMFVTNIVDATSFDIDSDTASDDSTVNWLIIKDET